MPSSQGYEDRMMQSNLKERSRRNVVSALIGSALAVVLCASVNAEPSVVEIVGAWKLYKDDDRPNGDVPSEVMSFWANGKFSISSKHSHKGLYRVKGNQLELLAKVDDRAIPVSREFQLNGEEIRFKNLTASWAYYRRMSKQPQGKEPRL